MGKATVSIIGNVGQKKPLKYLQSGDAVLNITVAVNKIGKPKDGAEKDPPTWFNVDFWRQQAELVDKYVQVGDEISIDGDIELREYERNDGTKGQSLDVHARSVTLLRNGRQGTGGSAPAPTATESSNNLSDIPF